MFYYKKKLYNMPRKNFDLFLYNIMVFDKCRCFYFWKIKSLRNTEFEMEEASLFQSHKVELLKR